MFPSACETIASNRKRPNTWQEEAEAKEQARTPAFDVALRNINENEYHVIVKASGEVIDAVDEGRAFFEVYPGATYLQQGTTYLVTYLDVHKLVAYVERCDVPYYTTQADHTEVTIARVLPIDSFLYEQITEAMQSTGSQTMHRNPPPDMETDNKINASSASHNSEVSGDFNPLEESLKRGEELRRGIALKGDEQVVEPKHGRVVVSVSVFAYHKIHKKFGTHLETVPLHLPTIQLTTKAFWVDIPPWVQIETEKHGWDFKGGVHGAAHAVAAIVPLCILCDSHADLATECPNVKENVRRPSRILVYEQHKGGLGVSATGCLLMPKLLALAANMIRECTCKNPEGLGCPSCVQSSACPEYNEVIDKNAALFILDCMIHITKRIVRCS